MITVLLEGSSDYKHFNNPCYVMNNRINGLTAKDKSRINENNGGLSKTMAGFRRTMPD